MTQLVSEINQENVDPVQPIDKPNLKELIKRLYIDELKKADSEGRDLFKEVQTKQEEISYLQKTIQGINAGINDKSELDLTKNPELKKMLDEAKGRLGLKLPENKTKFTAQEWQRLVDNAKSIIEDGNAQVQLKLNEVNRVNNKLAEIIKIFDSILKGLHHTIEETIRGNKMTISSIETKTHSTSLETVQEPKGFVQNAANEFVGFFKWLGSWIESAFSPSKEIDAPYELTPEQKTGIQSIYLQSLAILKDLDHPENKEEVKEFLRLLLQFYRTRQQILKEESEWHYQTYEFSRKQVQEHEEKERAEFEKMINDSKAANFWQKLTGAVTPIYTAVAALFLPPGLNVAVICISIILAIEELSDHSLTQSIAEATYGDNKSDQDLLASRLQMACSLLSFGIAIPVGYGATVPMPVVFGVAKATTGVGQTTSEMSIKTREGRITEINNTAEKFARKLNEQIENVQRVQKESDQTTRLTSQMIDSQKRSSPFSQGR